MTTLSRRLARLLDLERRPRGHNIRDPTAIQSKISAGANLSEETPTSGSANTSTAVPTLNKTAT
jgi:hypothetical protein